VEVPTDEAGRTGEQHSPRHHLTLLHSGPLMSHRLDLPIAALAWLGGFAWVHWKGTWGPLAVLAVLGAARLLLADPGTRRLLVPRRSTLALAAAGAVAMVGATYALYGPLGRVFPALPVATTELYGVLRAGGYGRISLAALVVIISACEEIVWRGRPLEEAELRPRTHPLTPAASAKVLSVALLYGACHLTSGSYLLALIAAACGLAWGLLRVAGLSLWPSILAHAAWDLAILVAWPLA
jgi:membrane protease YdiL (CAAX protease family)